MDIWEILPGKLYQSGAVIDDSWRTLGIDAIISLIHQEHPAEDRGFLHVQWPIEDGPVPDEGTLRALAQFVAGLLMVGRKVLVHCGAGVNRSGLLNALVLVVLGDDGGNAVEQIWTKRPGSLGNHNFVDWLLKQKASGD